MIDRMDIDALLVSALYGELTPADEARLTAHLESHPADRTALADLTHTRATIRESRILTFQFEPPQSVSALLLQEAARRAPRPRREEAAGWFHRFTRSFMMHPAMAAAAMLVLVVGVAGTLYVRRGDQFVEMAPPVTAANQSSTPSAAPPGPAPETTTAVTETGRAYDSKDRGAAEPPGAAAGSAGYRVGLDESADPQQLADQDGQAASGGRAKGGKSAVAANEAKEAKNDGKDEDDGIVAKRSGAYQAPPALAKQEDAPRPAKPTKLAKAGDRTGTGIELRSPELQPKDFDDEQRAHDEKRDQKADKPSKKASANRNLDLADADGDRAGASAADKLQQVPATGAGGGAATVAPGMIAPQAHAAASGPAADPAAAPPAAAPPPSTPAVAMAAGASSSPSNVGKFKAAEKTVSRSAPQGQAPSPQSSSAPAPAPSPPPPPAAIAADNRRPASKSAATSADAKFGGESKLAEDKSADDKALSDWAQKQRDQVLAFVKSNNCRAAANAAVEIYNRAPDYYAANIATDRSIKPCIAYVNDVRERADRSRAMKRVNAAEPPAQAAPPPARK